MKVMINSESNANSIQDTYKWTDLEWNDQTPTCSNIPGWEDYEDCKYIKVPSDATAIKLSINISEGGYALIDCPAIKAIVLLNNDDFPGDFHISIDTFNSGFCTVLFIDAALTGTLTGILVNGVLFVSTPSADQIKVEI